MSKKNKGNNDNVVYVQQPQTNTTQSQPSFGLVYVPQMTSKKLDNSISVIALILLVAMLFVGMKILSEDGFYEKEGLTWTRGYIGEDGAGVGEVDGWWLWATARGAFTQNAIPIKEGVKIKTEYGSDFRYQILFFDENENFIAICDEVFYGNRSMKVEDLTGDLPSTPKYFRLYVFKKGNFVDVAYGGIRPHEKSLTASDFSNIKRNVTVYVNQSDLAENVKDAVGNLTGKGED